MKTQLIATILIFLWATSAFGAGSSSYTPSISAEVKYYNKGVELMLDKKFAKAEKQFRDAISEKERFAEAHNNLAYVLRKQGPEYYTESLEHYNRAIAINPNLAEAYMYRGVLHLQMGNKGKAQNDYTTLKSMNPSLAEELQYVISSGGEKSPERFFGVSREI